MIKITQFRTKGKGNSRQVFPVGQKRKAYGISREIAHEDVMTLREKGDRARLIKTNDRLDLYAPYISELDMQNGVSANIQETEKPVEPVKTAKPEPVTDSNVINGMPPEDMPAINRMEQIRKRFKYDDITIRTDDGKTYVEAISPGHTTIAWKELQAEPGKEAMNDFNGTSPSPKISRLNFEKRMTVSADLTQPARDDLKKSAKELIKQMSDDGGITDGPHNKNRKYNLSDFLVTFYKPTDSDSGYMSLIPENKYKTPDENETYGKAIRIKMNGEKDTFSAYGAGLFFEAVKMYDIINDAPKGNKAKGERYYATMASDFPVSITKSKVDSSSSEVVESGVLLAPRMVNVDVKSTTKDVIKKLTGKDVN